MKKILLILALLFVFQNCEVGVQSDGDWDDNIGLSKKRIYFNAQANGVKITTKGRGWRVVKVALNVMIVI